MPSKLQHSRRKHSLHSKKKKDRRNPTGVIAQRQANKQYDKPITPPREVAPATSAPALLTSARYPHIFTELREIGILAGIILAILIVLALVLP